MTLRKIEWRQGGGTARFAYLGKVHVGTVGWKGYGENGFVVRCRLPGVKQPLEVYETRDGAKAQLEQMVTAWFSWVTEQEGE